MTDDFHLFGDPSDGNEPIDPDIALVTAYLARELSPMQVIALEERLATDAEFRAQMQPLIDSWAAPVPSLETGLARRTAPLSVLERSESWRRFQSEAIPAAPAEPIALDVPPARTTWRFSMKRVALLTAAIALPMASFAQVVVYTANHADVPGHVIARRIVSAFTHTQNAPLRGDSSDQRTSHVTADLTDGRIPRPLSAAKTAVAEPAKPVEPPTAPSSAAPAPRKSSVPNRALIAELTRQHQPELIRGDTSAEYVVMVLDAADGYLWSTIGNGNLGIEVAGDTRTAKERAAFTLEYRDEFWGDPSTRPEARGRGMNGGFGIGAAGRGRAAGGSVRSDSLVVADVSGRGRGFGAGGFALPDSTQARRLARGALSASRIVRGDTIYTLRYDSAYVYWNSGTTVGRGAAAVDSLRRGFGRGAVTSQSWESASGGYRAGWVGNAAGATVNRASGLEVPSVERSGVQGLGPLFVESAELYFFAPRELSSSNLRVMVVHLTPNATWRGPS